MIMATEMKLVEVEKVRKLKDRAIRLRKNVLTYFFGTLIKQFLEELDLWEVDENG